MAAKPSTDITRNHLRNLHFSTIAMLVSRLAVRAPALRQLHTTARLRSGHGDYNHLPFVAPFQGSKNVPFGLKMVAVLSFGFAIPFVAVQIQQAKKA
ncbi:hypothetical protein B0H19DRAFT_1178046 [Mycena capillaripes]|nr:hypothetical protein B0H19DRAFT_1178046 [Mycena capillaripes]